MAPLNTVAHRAADDLSWKGGRPRKKDGEAEGPSENFTPTIKDWKPYDGLAWDAPPGVEDDDALPSEQKKPDPLPEGPMEKPEEGWQKAAKIGAGALAVVGAAAGMMGTAAPALAAELPPIEATQTRSTTPVSVSSAEDVVARFSAEQQLYVQGNPANSAELAQWQEAVQKHPNVYVVLVEHTSDIDHYDRTVSRGVGNSSEFQSVRNELTGEKEGVLFVVVMDSNDGRSLIMRSEELPDRLGVGEENWTTQYGEPLRLFTMFLDGYNNQGLSPPLALERVMAHINSTIDTQTQNQVQNAQSAVDSAGTALESFEGTAREFQREHGRGGELGDPPIARWQAQMDQARESLQYRDFEQASRLAGEVSSELGVYQSAMANYEQAPEIARAIQQQLEQVQDQLEDLPSDFGGQARDQYRQASQGMEAYNTAYENKQFSFWEDLQEARAAAATAASSAASEAQRYEQALANYEKSPEVAEAVESQLEGLEERLANLPDNGHTREARDAINSARDKLASYRAQYKAKTYGTVWDTVVEARDLGVQAADATSAAEDHAEFVKTARTVGITALGVAAVATAVIMNVRAMRKRKEAKQALGDATAEIAQKSQELIALMERSDYHSIAGYTGKTKQMAEDLIENVTDALTLVGGAEKFLAEAENLIQPRHPINLFLTRRYEKGIALLTDPEEKMTFNFDDASKTVLEKGSKAEGWREELIRRGANREFKQSLYEVLLAMADRRDTAEHLLDEITTKNAEITTYLDGIEQEATGVRERSTALQESGKQDGFFTAPSVTEDLLPMVGDLIGQGRDIKQQDPVRAWEDYGDEAKRRTNDASNIVTVGEETRGSLLPTLGDADKALHPHDVKTDWAHKLKENYSERLDDAADSAMRRGVDEDLSDIRTDVAKLEVRVDTVVDQDQQRREVAPVQIKTAEEDVSRARQEIADALHGFGVFKDGTAEQVLRESDRDPTDRTVEAHENLEAIKPRLDVGDTEQAAVHLDNIKNLTQDSHRLVRETREALKSYHPTLDERQKRTESIDDSVEATYQPSLDRIKKTYEKEVLRLVAPEVNSGDTIDDNIGNANTFLGQARQYTGQAIEHFDQAQLLTSRDELAITDRVLKSAQGELDSITGAEQLLEQKQQAVERELSALESRVDGTRSRSRQEFVRGDAKRSLKAAEAALDQAEKAVKQTPKNPYTANKALSSAESARTSTENAIAADERAFNAAWSAVRSAESDINSAESTISWADSQSWSYSSSHGSASESVSSSDLSGATSALSSARSAVSSARGMIGSQDYEDAQSRARDASSYAGRAESEARSAVSRAKSRFDSEVRVIKQREEAARRAAEEARRRAEEQRRREAEERRRQEESRRGNAGGGGNGSRRGKW